MHSLEVIGYRAKLRLIMDKLISYSQNGEDIVLWRALNNIKNGFYLDVGASHPEEDSVTKIFYDAGWSGINLEPNKYEFFILRHERTRDKNINAAVSNFTGKSLFQISSIRGHSKLDDASASEAKNSVEVATYTLNDILSSTQDRVIHFLKVDVEGDEFKVIQGIDLSLHRPWIILVERISPDNLSNDCDLVGAYLEKNNYVHCLFDGVNDFYCAIEKKELKPALSYPANVLDNYWHNHLMKLSDNQLELSWAHQKITRLEKDILQISQSHHLAHQELVAMKKSRLWRMLSPFRALRRLLKFRRINKSNLFALFRKIALHLPWFVVILRRLGIDGWLTAKITVLLTTRQFPSSKVENVG